MNSTLQDVVGRVSPLLGAAVGAFIPGGSLIVSALAHLFGADGTNEDELAQKISTDPEATLKLKQFELAHQEALLTAATQVRLASYNREVEISKAAGKRDWVMEFIAVVMVLGFFGMCFIISFVPIVKTDTNLLYLVIGQFSTGFISILSYYFGATNHRNNSPQKSEMLLPSPVQNRLG